MKNSLKKEYYHTYAELDTMTNIILKILKNYKYYIPLSYLLIITGIFISKNINIAPFKSIILILLFTLSISCSILNIIFVKKISTKSTSFKEKFTKLTKIIGYISLIFIPLIASFNYYINYENTNSFMILFTITFAMSIYFTNIVREVIFPKNNTLQSNYAFTGAIALNLILSNPKGVELMNTILDNILSIQSFALLIAIIMLCIALSTASFNYCSILEEKSEIRKKIKKDGENYFISSILTMISIILLCITSYIQPLFKPTTLINLDLFSMNFLFTNVYSFLLIIILSFTIYSIYCIIKSSYSILKELEFLEHYFYR
ncbi:hypothetical protein [uncultured Methanobrevibacter sp.]|uniref:hypothetical protein n=1 Tax=uncultured Methanobrevibacter sp. TaxID=253161 RepID=UPI0025D4177C|nr:hypothetical protein [uncultured Methanobrevibacter sp.]